MRKFIIHITIFSFILFSTILFVLSLANGYSDSFYLKVSSPKQTNLILGTSKAAQGLQPQILHTTLKKRFYNFAFAMYASPYGNVYLNSIKNKLDTTSIRDNIFILAVDVWSLSSITEDPNDSRNFRENKSFLGQGINVTTHPNFKYLLTFFENKYYKILLKDNTAYLHDDGWLEVSLNEERESVERRTNFTVNTYKEMLRNYQFSSVRYSYLLKTIDFLKKFGSVYLVRLPVHPDIMKIENTAIYDFNSIIETAIKNSDGYWDLTIYNQDCEYTDGVHLNTSSGEIISDMIAKKIKHKYKARVQ